MPNFSKNGEIDFLVLFTKKNFTVKNMAGIACLPLHSFTSVALLQRLLQHPIFF